MIFVTPPKTEATPTSSLKSSKIISQDILLYDDSTNSLYNTVTDADGDIDKDKFVNNNMLDMVNPAFDTHNQNENTSATSDLICTMSTGKYLMFIIFTLSEPKNLTSILVIFYIAQ